MPIDNRQLEYVNSIVMQMNQISECAGKVHGLADVIVVRGRRNVDTDYLRCQLLDIADELSSTLAQMRFTIFPFDSKEDKLVKKELVK